MNKLFKDVLILTVITLVAGVALGGVEFITRAPIAEAEEATAKSAFEALFPDADSFVSFDGFDSEQATALADQELSQTLGGDWSSGAVIINDCLVASDKSGSELGKVIIVTNKKSYGGNVTLSVGISSENMITGYKITEISDTPGLGMKATEDGFMSKFANIPSAVYSVVKSGAGENEIEAISGATITSRAVTNAVDAAVVYNNSLNGGEQNESE